MSEIDLTRFELNSQVLSAFVSLISNGIAKGFEPYYRSHRMMKDTYIVLAHVKLPLNRSNKGTISLIEHDFLTYTEPSLSNDMKNYWKRTFQGYNIYLNPTHSHLSKLVRDDMQDEDIDIKVGIIILKKRGVFTFEL